MQSSPINAAQLMMEFLDREQADIGHEIIATEFSRELEQQKLSVDGASSPVPPPSSSMGNLPTDDTTPYACGAREPAPCDSARDNLSTQRKKCLKRLVSDGKPADAGQSKIQDEIHLTNPALLEKVLADLKVPAEARKACTSAEDKQGRLSLRGLLEILDKQTGDASALTPGKTMGRDVEALLKSLALPQGEASLSTEELVTKPGGLYSLGELRQLLDKVARQVQEARASRVAAARETGRQGTVLSDLKQGPGEQTISSLPPTRTASFVSSSMPSFLGRNQGGNDSMGPLLEKSLFESMKIPMEHLAGAQVLSMGQRLPGELQEMLHSALQLSRGNTLSLANPSWPNSLAQNIQDLLNERRTSHLTLELEPAELGRLTLRVETTHEEVVAALTAESEKAREILLRNAPALRQNLEEQGLTLGEFLVDVRDERGGNHHRFMSDGSPARRTSRGQAEIRAQRPQGDAGIARIRTNGDHLISVVA